MCIGVGSIQSRVAQAVSVGLLLALTVACGTAAGQPADDLPGHHLIAAAPGRVEGATQVIEVGVAMDGVIAETAVEEGDRVNAGDLIARLVCDDLEASLEAARAEFEVARQARRRLIRGSRDEERRVAAARTAEAEAVLEQAWRRQVRMRHLAEGNAIVSDEEVDDARTAVDVAESALRAAREHERLVNAPPLPEELERANAEVEATRDRLREAEARAAKCRITSPIAGHVLRLHLHEGEQVSLAVPRPVASLADLSRQTVRAEVDERDVGKVKVGQRAVITAAALGNAELAGRVTHIEPMMGRKRIRTGDPAEKADRDVQEIVVELDQVDPRLVVGLRATVVFLGEEGGV